MEKRCSNKDHTYFSMHCIKPHACLNVWARIRRDEAEAQPEAVMGAR